MSEVESIEEIESLFLAGSKKIQSIIEREKSNSSNNGYFWISQDVQKKISKEIGSFYNKNKIDLSSFSMMTKENKDRVAKAFENMLTDFDDSLYRWGRASIMYSIIQKSSSIFDSEKSFIDMSHYYISSSLTDYDTSAALLREGFFKNMSIFSDILKNWEGDAIDGILELCIDKCDVSILHKFKNHKNKNIRMKVYQRIGIQNCFEEMIKDKDRSIRLEALHYAPRDHESLSCLYGDRSKYVISKLIKLISREKAIFLLGNSKVQKNKFLQLALQEKINEVW